MLLQRFAPVAEALLLAVTIKAVLPGLAAVPLFSLIMLTGLAVALLHYRHAPSSPFGIANFLTLLRAALICAILTSLWPSQRPANIDIVQAALAGFALLLDWVDGRAARLFHRQSLFGRRFDVEIDNLFLLAASLIVIERELAGSWILLLPVARPLFAAARWRSPKLQYPLPKTRRRAFCSGLAGALLVAALVPEFSGFAWLALLSAVIVTMASFALDLAWLLRHQGVEAGEDVRVEDDATAGRNSGSLLGDGTVRGPH